MMPLQITEIVGCYADHTIAAQDSHELEGALTTVINLRWSMLRAGQKTFRMPLMRGGVTVQMLQDIADCLYRILNTRYGCDGMTRQ